MDNHGDRTHPTPGGRITWAGVEWPPDAELGDLWNGHVVTEADVADSGRRLRALRP